LIDSDYLLGVQDEQPFSVPALSYARQDDGDRGGEVEKSVANQSGTAFDFG